MKILKWSLIAVAALAILITAVGFALPSKYRVVRSTEIKAPAMKMSFAGATSRQGANYFAVLMDRMVGADFEQGLACLKRLAEKE